MKRKRLLNSDDISSKYRKSQNKKLKSGTVNKGKATTTENGQIEGRKTRSSGRVGSAVHAAQATSANLVTSDKQSNRMKAVLKSKSTKMPSKTNNQNISTSPVIKKSGRNIIEPKRSTATVQDKNDLDDSAKAGKSLDKNTLKSRSRKSKVPGTEEKKNSGDKSPKKAAKVSNKRSNKEPKVILHKHEPVDMNTSTSNNKTSDDTSDSSSEESEWEDVPELREEPIIPEGGVQFTIELSKSKKKMSGKNWRERFLQHLARRKVRKFRKRQQQELHKAQMLCFVAHGMFTNKIIQSDELKAVYLSLNNPPIYTKNPKNITKENLQGIVKKFREMYKLSAVLNAEKSINIQILSDVLCSQSCDTIEELVTIFAAILRITGFKVRLIYSFQPEPIKLKEREKKDKKNKPTKESENKEMDQPKNKSKNPEPKPIKQDPKLAERKRKKKSESSEDEDYEEISSDEDFEVKVSKKKKVSKVKKQIKQQAPKKVKSAGTSNSQKTDLWVEVYSSKYKKWLCVDVVNGSVIDPELMEDFVNEPMHYVLGYEDDGSFKDLTAYYAKNFMVNTTKLRVDSKWWAVVLNAFACKDPAKQVKEELELCNFQMEKPLPASIYEYKNHPLYVLRRHLLKLEAIYPPDINPVGFVKKEPVYPRESVHMLRTTDMWLKEACQIKPKEEPYKIVAAPPRYNKALKKFETGLSTGAYGKWQVEPYRPPKAVNGKVPRNDRGFVDLYKPSMLPIGTVHILDMPEVNKTAKRLGIDCALAFKGWETTNLVGPNAPIYHGWVVCSEHYETLKLEYFKHEASKKKKEQEKRENRVYGNWKKLIRGMLIKERLKARYSK